MFRSTSIQAGPPYLYLHDLTMGLAYQIYFHALVIGRGAEVATLRHFTQEERGGAFR